jgi:hypothetical protein
LEFRHDLIVVAINLTFENFNEVPLPELGGREANTNRQTFNIEIAVLGGCLTIAVRYIQNTNIWVMKEYGSRDSWQKLFTLIDYSCFIQPLRYLRPLGYSNDKQKVLLRGDYKRLFWYDLMSEKFSRVTGVPDWKEAVICVGSLVPPTCVPIEIQHMSRCESISKRRYFLLSILLFVCYRSN